MPAICQSIQCIMPNSASSISALANALR